MRKVWLGSGWALASTSPSSRSTIITENVPAIAHIRERHIDIHLCLRYS